ncbi:hypothetical protein R0137_08370 [Congregibacter brevis]|jgi:hypothetical protein|uniref:DNA-binding protein n=1 Tax=Congregibacter brevis TaxID=3081201 RepID=A0ABZ0IHR1_9GAMM|nr:hypothetical protein R0137_08370 [Congregibacter sp. IMCC45268]
MDGKHSSTYSDLATEITQRFGVLLTHSQLAELLGRSSGGLRYSLISPTDERTRALRDCGCRIGRRFYYPALDVANIISGEHRS